MKIASEIEMFDFAKSLAKNLGPHRVIELIGDVGVGKTTFVRGFAKALGVKEPVTSPSFTISKSYAFPGGMLVHYDFYRLDDPGIMAEDLAENLADRNAIVVIEWSDSVQDLLPTSRLKLKFTYEKDGSRTVEHENQD